MTKLTWRPSWPMAFVAGALAGCMAGGAPSPAQAPATGAPPPSEIRGGIVPLLIDRTDLRIGTTVHFTRIPSAGEIHDLTFVTGLAHIVLALPQWPADFGPLEALSQVPHGTDVIVLLQGYPPSRSVAELWNLVSGPVRIVIMADGPPLSRSVIDELNAMRPLERVVAQMDEPSRTGFERLQRPLSFRKVIP